MFEDGNSVDDARHNERGVDPDEGADRSPHILLKGIHALSEVNNHILLPFKASVGDVDAMRQAIKGLRLLVALALLGGLFLGGFGGGHNWDWFLDSFYWDKWLCVVDHFSRVVTRVMVVKNELAATM